ncbi:MAG: FkbM family methyltransferase [Pirellulales bacterium]|nr:FkbM family methyltransferase [Pirellulales bacterium]
MKPISWSKTLELAWSGSWNKARNKLQKSKTPGCKYRNYHSQYGEDRYLHQVLQVPATGTFVDVGAGDPIVLSNTFFFEQNGWQGLCIDADRRQCKRLEQERARVEWAAVSSEPGEVDVYLMPDPNFSTILQDEQSASMTAEQVTKVKAEPLETLLEKHQIGQIDLLDIDVEGAEIDVWRSMDYHKHRPQVVIVEYLAWGVGDRSEEILGEFANYPYRMVHKSPTNLIFQHN